MQKLTINGIDIEFDDNIELSVEGNKVTIRAKPAVTTIIHEHRQYQPLPFYPPTPYWVPYTVPQPNSPIITCGGSTNSTVGNVVGNLTSGMLQ